jgi:hypothetical protein
VFERFIARQAILKDNLTLLGYELRFLANDSRAGASTGICAAYLIDASTMVFHWESRTANALAFAWRAGIIERRGVGSSPKQGGNRDRGIGALHCRSYLGVGSGCRESPKTRVIRKKRCRTVSWQPALAPPASRTDRAPRNIRGLAVDKEAREHSLPALPAIERSTCAFYPVFSPSIAAM